MVFWSVVYSPTHLQSRRNSKYWECPSDPPLPTGWLGRPEFQITLVLIDEDHSSIEGRGWFQIQYSWSLRVYTIGVKGDSEGINNWVFPSSGQADIGWVSCCRMLWDVSPLVSSPFTSHHNKLIVWALEAPGNSQRRESASSVLAFIRNHLLKCLSAAGWGCRVVMDLLS